MFCSLEFYVTCYNLIKNNCTGSCQGCSDCPVCVSYYMGNIRNTTRWQIVKYVFSSKLEYFKMWIWFKMNAKKVKQIMKESVEMGRYKCTK